MQKVNEIDIDKCKCNWLTIFLMRHASRLNKSYLIGFVKCVYLLLLRGDRNTRAYTYNDEISSSILFCF